MGRPRKPTALKILHGDFDKNPQRRNQTEPMPREGRPRMPSGFSEAEKTRWRFMCDELAAMRLETPANLPILEAYVRTWYRWQKTSERIRKEGETIETDFGERVHPLSRVVRELLESCNRMLAQLGFTPAARSALHVATSKSDKPAAVMRRERG